MKKSRDVVFEICSQMLAASPERSYKRLNPALRSTLSNCIEAGLPFAEDTFSRIYDGLRGGWWFGDGAGSHVGEGFYTAACSLGHASAQQSFEHFAGRPACLWEEKVKTPTRLHVGAQFTWRGYYVTVTSMRRDRLVACTYQDYPATGRGLKIGASLGYDPEYLITSAKKEGATTFIGVIKASPTRGERVVARRFAIAYDAIAGQRGAAKSKVKAMVEKIALCDPDKDGAKLTHEINAEHFRHFELEEIQAAFQKRREWAAAASKIEAWRGGANGAWLGVKETLIRVKEDRVDCSNGNSVSKAAAKRVLPVLMAQRNHGVMNLNLPIDSYRIDGTNREGVKIGCTVVPWSEIERIAPELEEEKTA